MPLLLPLPPSRTLLAPAARAKGEAAFLLKESSESRRIRQQGHIEQRVHARAQTREARGEAGAKEKVEKRGKRMRKVRSMRSAREEREQLTYGSGSY